MVASRLRRIAVSLVAGLALVLLMAASTSAHVDWPFVTAQTTAVANGNRIVYKTTVTSHASQDLLNVQVKVLVPPGTMITGSGTGDGVGNNAGRFDGQAIGWVIPNLKSQGTVTSFNLEVEPVTRTAAAPNHVLTTYPWVWFPGGSATGDSAWADNPAPISEFSVSLTEFVISPDHLVVKAGTPVTIMAKNDSARNLPHDLHIEGQGMVEEVVAGAGSIAGGQSASKQITFTKPGTYTIWCPVGTHRQRGMEGTLIVTP